jgi:hypothetical protein
VGPSRGTLAVTAARISATKLSMAEPLLSWATEATGDVAAAPSYFVRPRRRHPGRWPGASSRPSGCWPRRRRGMFGGAVLCEHYGSDAITVIGKNRAYVRDILAAVID